MSIIITPPALAVAPILSSECPQQPNPRSPRLMEEWLPPRCADAELLLEPADRSAVADMARVGPSLDESPRLDVTALVRARALAAYPSMVRRAERRIRHGGFDVANETIRVLWGSEFFAPPDADAENFAVRVVEHRFQLECLNELRRRYRAAALLDRLRDDS